MNKVDYNKLMIDKCKQVCNKPKLLLHTCCAVCAGGVLARQIDLSSIRDKKGRKGSNDLEQGDFIKKLTDFFAVTLYFSNDNIDTKDEYLLRAGECEKLLCHFGVELIVAEYVPSDYERVAKGLENEKEQGSRCDNCIGMRIEKSAKFASENGFEFVGSTLTVSPHKNATLVNTIIEDKCDKYGLKPLYSDFKKQSGFLTASSVAQELGIYRQSYCGCRFAKHASVIE